MNTDYSTASLLASANPAVNSLAPQMQDFDLDGAAARERLAAAQAAYLQARQPNPAATAFTRNLVTAAQQPGLFMIPEQAPVQASFANSVGRGIDQLQQSLYGFAAQVGDMAGSKDLRNWGLLGAYSNEDQIAANPRAVPSISDINSVGAFIS